MHLKLYFFLLKFTFLVMSHSVFTILTYFLFHLFFSFVYCIFWTFLLHYTFHNIFSNLWNLKFQFGVISKQTSKFTTSHKRSNRYYGCFGIEKKNSFSFVNTKEKHSHFLTDISSQNVTPRIKLSVVVILGLRNYVTTWVSFLFRKEEVSLICNLMKTNFHLANYFNQFCQML